MSRPNKCYQTEDGPIWHSRSVAVVGVVLVSVNKKIYVLVTKRSDTMEEMPGRWCLPCGYLDFDEDIKQATVREILEETGLEVLKLEEVKIIDTFRIDSTPNTKRQNVSISTIFATTSLKNLPELKLTSEVSELEWCEVSNLGEKNLVFNHFNVVTKALSSTIELWYTKK